MSEKENICEDAMIAVSKMASGVSCQGASHFLLISTFNFHNVFVHFQHVNTVYCRTGFNCENRNRDRTDNGIWGPSSGTVTDGDIIHPPMNNVLGGQCGTVYFQFGFHEYCGT